MFIFDSIAIAHWLIVFPYSFRGGGGALT